MALLSILVLASCGGGSETDAGTTPADAGGGDAGSGGRVDITDAVFVERSGDCADYAFSAESMVTDIRAGVDHTGLVDLVAGDTACMLTSNAIPNHDFDDTSAAFATPVAEIETTFAIPRRPTMAASTTALMLRSFDGVMLNGVVLDLLAAGCFGVGDGRIGCMDLTAPWRYDPMSPLADFGTDMHHAHTQPDGRYHYHGDPLAMYGEPTAPSPVIGFAADGFPIYGPYFDDGGTVRAAVSGYALRSGARPSGTGDPGGSYDGTYVDDYEYAGTGDLDECNGMTVDGQYGYYVTATYPWVLACLRGTPDPSFDKGPMM
ncbi:MAG: YHYH protein [Myxococcales bacterium]|nr:YHYH protein [Myxococcales bacterium]